MCAGLPDDFPRGRLIEDLAGRLARHPAIERIWLFGSRALRLFRALGHRPRERGADAGSPRVQIKPDFEDTAQTLLVIDLMRWEEAPEDLREQIGDEGIVIYERERTPAAVR
jgi:Polymerase beta, Nucleotidyltransferase